jgi:hypothetical protein
MMSLLAVAIAGVPAKALGQEKKKDKPAAEKKEPVKGEKKKGGLPFRGKLGAVDKSAKTIKVGERVFQITSDTRLTKAGKPVTLDDGVVGEEVGIYYHQTDNGKWVAQTVRFGPKPEAKAGGEPAPKKKKGKE